MRVTLRLVATAWLGLFVLFGCATRPAEPVAPEKIIKGDATHLRHYLDWLIREEMSQHKLTGLSIALVSEDKLLWQNSYGYADKANKLAVTPSTLFRAGSLSKLFNALAIMQLVEAGKLDLDEPIRQYLPDFSIQSRFPDSQAITTRSLLTHHSGLPSDYIKGMWSQQAVHYRETLRYLKRSYVTHPVNSFLSYSNLAHNVLGVLIETLSGLPYEEYMREHIFKPLQMQATAFSAWPSQPLTAKSYRRNKAVLELPLRDVPAAGLSTNVEDMAHFLRFFTGQSLAANHHALISRESIALMLSNQMPNSSLNLGDEMGLAWYVDKGRFHKGITIFEHSGATVGQRALLKWVPEHAFGLVILSNSQNAGASLNRIANKALALLYAVKTGEEAPLKRPLWPKAQQADRLSPGDMVGSYATLMGLVHITQKGEKLKAQLRGRTFTLSQKREGGLYYPSYKLWGIFPINLGGLGLIGLSTRQVNDQQSVLVASNTRQRRFVVGLNISPSPISPVWQARLGAYSLIEPLEIARISKAGLKLKNGFLVAYAHTERTGDLEFVLLPQNDEQAIVAGMGRGLGETVKARDQDGQSEIEFSGIRFVREH